MALDLREAPTTGALRAVAADAVVQSLQAFGDVPPALQALLQQAALRLLDSSMIIRLSAASERARPPAAPDDPLPFSPELVQALQDILQRIRAQGFGPHYQSMLQTLQRLMLESVLAPEQRSDLDRMFGPGQHVSFLMTDAGGPALNQWRTTCETRDGATQLNVDKVWIMVPPVPGFAFVVARTPGSMLPSIHLLTPEQFKQLSIKPFGEAFFSGHVQLANISGRLDLPATSEVRGGGLTSIGRQFAVLRPHFVRAFLAHVRWLQSSGRLQLPQALETAAEFLEHAGSVLGNHGNYSPGMVKRTLALKLAANELLLALVAGGGVPGRVDERDLLAFTKMEGSSYRMYKELTGGVV